MAYQTALRPWPTRRPLVLLVPLLLLMALGAPPRSSHAALKRGDPSPDLSWPTLDGGSRTWPELQEGRPLVVVFWATWCSVCKKEWPELIALHDELASNGAAPSWAAVSVGEKSKVVAREVKARHLVGTQLLDPEEKNFEELGLKYIPHVYVIDLDGVVAYSGRPDVKKLRKVLEKIEERRTETEESR